MASERSLCNQCRKCNDQSIKLTCFASESSHHDLGLWVVLGAVIVNSLCKLYSRVVIVK